MTALASFLLVMALSLVIARIASVALAVTGISREVAKFQARSALTGTGFTTTEAEGIVNHPVRRRIIMALMVLRNAGLITAVTSLFLSFAGTGGGWETVLRAGLVGGGIFLIWLVSLSKVVDRYMTAAIRWALGRFTRLDARDYVSLLDLGGQYAVRELQVEEGGWLEGRSIGECKLDDEGILVLGITRRDGTFIGAPTRDTTFKHDDNAVVYGRAEALEDLEARIAGLRGAAEHEEAKQREREAEREEARLDPERYPEKRSEEE